MTNATCLNCGASAQEKPLLTLKFQGNTLYICPQCMPILIHKSYELVDKIPGLRPSDPPSDHNH